MQGKMEIYLALNEIQDGKNIDNEDNYVLYRKNKVGNFFEEGLVDNVLYPLKKFFEKKRYLRTE